VIAARCRHGATTKLRKAGRTFLLRLVAKYGPLGAARIPRRLADEIEMVVMIAEGQLLGSCPDAAEQPHLMSHSHSACCGFATTKRST
jgi:hypothetical protein